MRYVSESWDTQEMRLSISLGDDQTKRIILLWVRKFLRFVESPINAIDSPFFRHSVHEVTPKTPVMFLIIDGLQDQDRDVPFQAYLEPDEMLNLYYVTRVEQYLFLHLSHPNREHVSPGFLPPYNLRKQHFKLGF
jgi:hypothetical protein